MNDKPPQRSRQHPHRVSRTFSYLLTGAFSLVLAGWAIGLPQQFPGVGVSDLSALPDFRGLTVPVIAGIFLLIGVNATLVLAETAVSLLKPGHIRGLKEGSEESHRLGYLFDHQPEVVAAMSFANQLLRVFVLFLGLILALSLAGAFDESTNLKLTASSIFLSAFIVAIPLVILNLVFGELIPKSFATLHPVQVASRTYRFTRATGLLFALPAAGVVGAANLFATRFGGKASLVSGTSAEAAIITLVETAHETGEIERDESELIQSVFEFNDTVAREVMTPRVDVDAMPVTSNPEELVAVIQESGHSRIPLFEGTDDQIVGIIHAKDLLMGMISGQPVSLRKLMRPPVFFPENKNLHDMLSELRDARTQLAIVQDEFGGTAGVITIEDIVEELVGDIQDEYDEEEPEVSATELGFLVDGKTHLDDLNDELGSDFESEDFATIGGYVFGLFGRQPKLHESIESNGYEFVVVETDGRRILRMKISKIDEMGPDFSDGKSEKEA